MDSLFILDTPKSFFNGQCLPPEGGELQLRRAGRA
jgi:hypothetical protein